jgi:16S rRNA A1518/A1519 N6-dimethyltransferase RsmA/KsgA/DIM1 with predicted DNA glycosylase/AP lyase activity
VEATAVLDGVGIEPTARPEVVTPANFAKLFRELKSTTN